MTVLSLHVIRLKYSHDIFVPVIRQILCDHISPLKIIQQHMRFVFHLWETSLDKHVWNMRFFKLFVQIHMPAENLAFTRFNDNPVNILA